MRIYNVNQCCDEAGGTFASYSEDPGLKWETGYSD